MAKDPAFLFYSADFYMGTVGMTDAQVGQYIRLMCLQHQQGRLSETAIKAITGGQLDPVIMAKFVADEDGLYYNERLEIESERRKNYTKSRRANRKKAETDISNEETHVDHMNNICGTYEKDMLNICSDQNTTTDESYVEHMETETETVTVTKNKRGVPRGEKVKNSIPPTPEQVAEYCQGRKNGIDPQQWFDFYASKGWMIGKNPMKDWQAAIRTWEKSEFRKPKSLSPPIYKPPEEVDW